jgi:hypothetical protein
MKPTSYFSLRPLLDKRWGANLASDVLFDGRPTGVRVEGSLLTGQFETSGGHLLLTEYEPPFDQSLKIYLLNDTFAVLDVRKVSYILQHGAARDLLPSDGKLRFSFISGHVWEVEILARPKFMIYRRAPAETQAFDKDTNSRWFARRHIELRLIQ